MRPKTQRAYRRLMNSYKLAFGFRPPYQLLVDADFCMEATKQKLDMNKELGVTFQQPTKTCNIQELRKKGPEGLHAARLAREFERRRCPHTHNPISSAECLAQVVGPENKYNYCVLSQNEALRKQLREIPGVPMFYVKSHMIVMEIMTAKSKEIIQQKEQQKLLPTSAESEWLKMTVDKEEGEEAEKKKKKKKIKGPNPLSVKKTKKIAPPPPKKRKREEESKNSSTVKAPAPTTTERGAAGETEPAKPSAEETAEKKKNKRKRRKKTKHDD
ncbi:Fcf1-domain-containing protein [Dichotomocladium elegans]|nr:Fcf1-domain-containing protein [Dichotomocladium elegans]